MSARAAAHAIFLGILAGVFLHLAMRDNAYKHVLEWLANYVN